MAQAVWTQILPQCFGTPNWAWEWLVAHRVLTQPLWPETASPAGEPATDPPALSATPDALTEEQVADLAAELAAEPPPPAATLADQHATPPPAAKPAAAPISPTGESRARRAVGGPEAADPPKQRTRRRRQTKQALFEEALRMLRAEGVNILKSVHVDSLLKQALAKTDLDPAGSHRRTFQRALQAEREAANCDSCDK